MSPILIIPELETIQRLGKGALVLSGTPFDAAFAKTSAGQTTWVKPAPQFHHWAVLRQLAAQVTTPKTAIGRLDAAVGILTTASVLFDDLRASGVGFETATGGRHLQSWLRGVQIARTLLAT